MSPALGQRVEKREIDLVISDLLSLVSERLFLRRSGQSSQPARRLQGPNVDQLALGSRFSAKQPGCGRGGRLVRWYRQLAGPEQAEHGCSNQKEQHDCRDPLPEFH